VEGSVLSPSIGLIGWRTNGVNAEDTLPPAISLENGFDFVWLGFLLLTPLRPIFCSLISEYSKFKVDLADIPVDRTAVSFAKNRDPILTSIG